MLRQATKDQATPVAFIDPRVVDDSTVRALIRSDWRGGIIVPAPITQENLANRLELSLERSEQMVVRTNLKGKEDFRIAVMSVIDEILARIGRFGEVKNSPRPNDGPTSRPRISNA